MQRKIYKEVQFDQNISNHVEYDNFDPEESVIDPLNQFGFKEQRLYNKNIRELSIAIKGVQEFYVATSSGGAVTTKITLTDGVLTEVT